MKEMDVGAWANRDARESAKLRIKLEGVGVGSEPTGYVLVMDKAWAEAALRSCRSL